MTKYAPKPTIHSIKTALDEKADINGKNQSTGFTPLHYALAGPHKWSITKEIIELLIDNKANVNAKDTFAFTPLYLAAQGSSWEIIELLIENNADLNVNSCDIEETIYDSLFRFSEINFSEENIQFLVKHGANFNHQYSYSGGTFLHRYFKEKALTLSEELLRYLIKYKADVNIADKNNVTAFLLAAGSASWEMINFLIDNGADVESLKNDRDSVLLLRNNNIDWDDKKLEFLCKHGLDFFFKKSFELSRYYNLSFESLKVFEQQLFIDAKKEGSPFPWNILNTKTDNIEKIKYLVEKNFHKTHTILDRIIGLKYDQKLIEYLIENNSNVNQTDAYESPLSQASAQKNLNLVKYLVAQKAEVDLVSLNSCDELMSPLMHCIYNSIYQDNSGFEIIKFLIENRANINFQTPSLKTPLHSATTQINYIVKNPLEGKGFLKYMIKNKADINLKNEMNQTPFGERNEIQKNIMLTIPLLECHRDEFNKNVTPTFLMSLKIWVNKNLKSIFPKDISKINR